MLRLVMWRFGPPYIFPSIKTPVCNYSSYPKALRTHNIRLLRPKTILYKAFGRF